MNGTQTRRKNTSHRAPALLFLCAALLLLLPSHSRPQDGGGNWFAPPGHLDRVEYVILTSRALEKAWEPMADWKTAGGCPTVVVAVEDVYANPVYRGVDRPETIRNFLKDLYWKWGLTWVLLGGDVNVVPTRFVELLERGACDIYFGALDGTWNEDGDAEIGGARDRVTQQTELFVGRIPVETPGEVNAFLNKYFHYVKATHRNYQKKILAIGAVLGADYHWDADDHYQYVLDTFFKPAGFKSVHLEPTDFLRGVFEKDPATGKCSGYVFGKPNNKDGDALLPRVVQEINSGFGIVSHYDHSNTYLMGLSQGGIRPGDVKKFTNLERPSLIISSGCHVNQFDMESVSEAFMLHPGGGAVAFIGCTVNSFAYENLYERDFYEALFRHGEYRLGRLFEASRARQSASNRAGANPITVLNRNLALLGDPHMPVWSDRPRDLSVSLSRPAPGAAALDVAVSGPSGPVKGARAAIWAKGEYLATALADDGGAVTLPLPRSGIAAVTLTVTAKGYAPHQETFQLPEGGPSGMLRPLDITAESRPSPAAPENRQFLLTVVLENRSETKSGPITAQLSGKDPFLKLVNKDCAYEPVDARGVALPGEPFLFDVNGSPPAHHRARFRLAIKNGGALVYEGPIRFSVTAPSPRLAGHRLRRGGEPGAGPIDAGETSLALSLSLLNRGTAAARNLSVRLECPSPDITVSDGDRTIPELAPGGVWTFEKPFPVDVSPSFGGGPVEFILSMSGPGFARKEEVFTILAPPPPPTELKAEASAGSVRLTWRPVEASRLAGYVVQRADAAQGPFVNLNATPVRSSCYEDAGLEGQRTYHYRVMALDRDLNAGSPAGPISVATTFPLHRDWPKKAKNAVDHVTVCDVDGDGDLEIATADGQGVWIWHHTGEELRHGGDNWTFGLFKELPEGGQTPSFADLDGDGKMEVFTAGRHKDRKVYVFRLDGSDFPGWPKDMKSRLMTPPQIADLDRDGHLEVVFHDGFGKNLYLWRKDGSAYLYEKKKGKMEPKPVIGKTDPFCYFLKCLVDLDGDGRREIAGLGGRGTLFACQLDGKPLEGFPHKSGKVLGSSTVAGDVNGDGRPELVFAGSGGTELWAVDGKGAGLAGFPVKVWDKKPSEGRSLPILAELDGKPGLEIILGGRGGELYVIDGKGKALPGFPAKLPEEATGCAAGDLDGDGDPEIVCGCVDGNIYGFHHDGATVTGFPLRTAGPVRCQPVICDIDGDGRVNLVAGAEDGYVYIWDLSGQYDPGAVQWAQYGADPSRRGCYLKVPNAPSGLKVRGDDRARLTWQGPRKTRVKRYHVWRSDGGPFVRITAEAEKGVSFVDGEVVPGRLYAYAVTSLDARGLESRLCEPVSWGEDSARELLEKAQKFEGRKKFRQAIRAYEDLIENFPGFRFLEDARRNLDRLKSDTGVQETMEARRRDAWCRGMLALAGTYVKSGKPERARESLQKILDRYPATSWADKATEEMKGLEKR